MPDLPKMLVCFENLPRDVVRAVKREPEQLKKITILREHYGRVLLGDRMSQERAARSRVSAAESTSGIDLPPAVNYDLIHAEDRRSIVESKGNEVFWHFSETGNPEQILADGFKARGNTLTTVHDYVRLFKKGSPFISTTRRMDLATNNPVYVGRRYRFKIDSSLNEDPTGVDVAGTLKEQYTDAFGDEGEVAFAGKIDSRAVSNVYDLRNDRTGRWNANTQRMEWVDGEWQNPIGPDDLFFGDPMKITLDDSNGVLALTEHGTVLSHLSTAIDYARERGDVRVDIEGRVGSGESPARVQSLTESLSSALAAELQRSDNAAQTGTVTHHVTSLSVSGPSGIAVKIQLPPYLPVKRYASRLSAVLYDGALIDEFEVMGIIRDYTRDGLPLACLAEEYEKVSGATIIGRAQMSYDDGLMSDGMIAEIRRIFAPQPNPDIASSVTYETRIGEPSVPEAFVLTGANGIESNFSYEEYPNFETGKVSTERWTALGRPGAEAFVFHTHDDGSRSVSRPAASGELIRVGYTWEWRTSAADPAGHLFMTRRIHLRPDGVRSTHMDALKRNVRSQLNTLINQPAHRLSVPGLTVDGSPVLHVEVEFVDDAATADAVITVRPGLPGQRDMVQDVWYAEVRPEAYVHEIIHGFGVRDDNAPPRALLLPGKRSEPHANPDTSSLMGPFTAENLGRPLTLTEDHLHQMAEVFAPHARHPRPLHQDTSHTANIPASPEQAAPSTDPSVSIRGGNGALQGYRHRVALAKRVWDEPVTEAVAHLERLLLKAGFGARSLVIGGGPGKSEKWALWAVNFEGAVRWQDNRGERQQAPQNATGEIVSIDLNPRAIAINATPELLAAGKHSSQFCELVPGSDLKHIM
ncbi:scabin-related ADP-ribosyltransferase [Streptomyces zhihengii]|uniref:scabin-related ADP-ribosyltransferase n=1 Tax=Streptomyces zhihengii TaxID=1818004 RepID=UPI0033B87560